ncbi:MAG: DUF5014 domain-containing protein [Bacteroidales bacterium]|nr:DUF5014 domain-containing protein [Bacteroidales bacterium]
MKKIVLFIAFAALLAGCTSRVLDQNSIPSLSTRAGGEDLNNENAIYLYPWAPFYSTDTQNLYFNCPSYVENSLLMYKYDFVNDIDGSEHPNPELGEEGWTLLNACEFHAIDGWSYSRSALNTYGVNEVKVENGWGAQNTTSVEKNLFVDNEKYTNVTDCGYLSIWACPDTALNVNKEYVFVGAGGCYANKVNAAKAIPQNTPIGEGTRVEIRARLLGQREGFLLALWLQGNDTELTWPEYGEIDIMENHVNLNDNNVARNTVTQTLHWGSGNNNPSVTAVMDNVEDWNIYWVEIPDAETVRFGINGETTAEYTAADANNDDAAEWPFCNEFNPSGFHILLNIYAGWNSDSKDPHDWATEDFCNLTYPESIYSDVPPRLDIDWIRYWKNDNYNYEDMDFPLDGNNQYAHMY